MMGIDGIRFCVVSIYCVNYDNMEIALTWCDWEAAFLITVEIAEEVGDCHIDMLCLVIYFCLW